jgi:hypothetical protein
MNLGALASSLLRGVGDELIYDTLKGALRSFASTGGTKVAEVATTQFQKWAATQFGIGTQDERIFNEAFAKLSPSQKTRLLKRLEALPDNKTRNFYRITVANDDPNVVKANLESDALLSDTDWARKCTFMYENIAKYEGLLKDFIEWIGGAGKAVVVGLGIAGKVIITRAAEASHNLDVAIADTGVFPAAGGLLDFLWGDMKNSASELKKELKK